MGSLRPLARLPSLQPRRISRHGRRLCRALSRAVRWRRTAPRSAGMGDDPRRALGPRRLAIRSGSGWTAGRADDGRRRTDDRRQTLGYHLSSAVCGLSSDLSSAQILRRVNRGRTFADFKMQLRRGDIAGLTGMGNDLPAFHRFTALDQDVAGMGIRGNESVRVPDQNEIAIALKLVAGIGDHAIFGSLDRGAFRNGKIDAVVLHPVWLGTERDNDSPAHRPAEARKAADRLRGLDCIVLAA